MFLKKFMLVLEVSPGPKVAKDHMGRVKDDAVTSLIKNWKDTISEAKVLLSDDAATVTWFGYTDESVLIPALEAVLFLLLKVMSVGT